MPVSSVSSGENFEVNHPQVEIAIGADVLAKDLAEKPAAEAAVPSGGEERVVGLLEPIVRVGVAAEMRIAQVELRRPWQAREFVTRFDIPGCGLDPPVGRIVSFQRKLAVDQHI